MKHLIARSALPTTLLLASAALCAPPADAGRLYHVESLSSLGGTSSVGYSINNRGWVAGRSNLAGNPNRHATLWRDGALTDLGSLGGPDRNSAVLWPVKNVNGIIAGITQTAEPDPLDEIWSCGYFFPAATRRGYRCVGFEWRDGVMTPLPTLGGTHGFATGANNLGQIVGWAENTVHDPTCNAPQVLQFRAVVWGPRQGSIHELPPLPGDTTSAATAINDLGQVVGISGICSNAVGGYSAIHDVLWENGKPIDIGDLGGVAWNTPMAINAGGDVVGFANAPGAVGDDFDPRAFLWIRGQGISNLGTLSGGGSGSSQALGINRWRQVVGQSCDDDDVCHAFVWEAGTMSDLNGMVASGDDIVMTTANDIDDSGRITGQAYDPASGHFVAFIATPVKH